jgi:phosphonate transport system ATP-binding protein
MMARHQLGGNGSGKTTLLRCISRMLSPTAGEIWLNDTNLATLSGERLRQARLPLAMIWQHASLVRRRSVLSNVAAGALGRYGGLWTALGGLPAVERHAAYDYLSAVGLAIGAMSTCSIMARVLSCRSHCRGTM